MRSAPSKTSTKPQRTSSLSENCSRGIGKADEVGFKQNLNRTSTDLKPVPMQSPEQVVSASARVPASMLAPMPVLVQKFPAGVCHMADAGIRSACMYDKSALSA